MSAQAEYRCQPFYDARLTPQQNKAAEMAFNGFSCVEIADELDVSDKHVSVVLHQARKRGVNVWLVRRHSSNDWPPERLYALQKRGLTYAQIASRSGLSRSTVAVQLHRARKKNGAPPYDTRPRRTPEQLRLWLRWKRDGVSISEIARREGVTRNAVNGALNRFQRRQSKGQAA